MTAQVSEKLLHRGTTLFLAGDPLHDYFLRLNKARRPDFVWSSTACWRGYVGTWEFRDRFLCLVGLRATVRVNGRVVEADLDTVIPSAKGCLRATWLTARLRCPEGRLVHYVHQGFASTYERDRWFDVRNGSLVDEFVEVNPPPPLLYRIDENGDRHCVRNFVHTEAIEDPLKGKPLTDAHLVWGRKPEGEPNDGYLVGGCLIRDVIS